MLYEVNGQYHLGICFCVELRIEEKPRSVQTLSGQTGAQQASLLTVIELIDFEAVLDKLLESKTVYSAYH